MNKASSDLVFYSRWGLSEIIFCILTVLSDRQRVIICLYHNMENPGKKA